MSSSHNRHIRDSTLPHSSPYSPNSIVSIMISTCDHPTNIVASKFNASYPIVSPISTVNIIISSEKLPLISFLQKVLIFVIHNNFHALLDSHLYPSRKCSSILTNRSSKKRQQIRSPSSGTWRCKTLSTLIPTHMPISHWKTRTFMINLRSMICRRYLNISTNNIG